jgi:hypothetical protein
MSMSNSKPGQNMMKIEPKNQRKDTSESDNALFTERDNKKNL